MSVENEGSTVWVHRPHDGRVAWGVAVLVAPAVPLLSTIVLLCILAVTSKDVDGLLLFVAPLPWLLVGCVLTWIGPGRVSRGVGLGLIAGTLASLVVASVAAAGDWR